MRDPGLDLQELEELLRIQAGDETLRAQYAELEAAHQAAREVADRYEQSADVDPGLPAVTLVVTGIVR